MSLREVQALLEGLEAERPEMMGHIRALPSDDSMSYQDKVLYIREIIRQDYDSYTSVFLSASSGGEPIDQHLPPLPPLARGETDAATRELIKLLNEEDSRKRRFFFCAVCLNDEAEINGSFTLDCGHRFCSECLERYIGSKIEGNEVSDDKLICPASDCNCPITHTTVRGLTVDVGNRKAFEKFDSFRTDLYIHTAILLGKGMRCPSETCNYAFEWCPDGSSLAFECPQCASSYCLNCAAAKGGIGPGHAPFSCEIQLERMAELAEERRKYDEWVELNGKANELFENMISANNWRSKFSFLTKQALSVH